MSDKNEEYEVTDRLACGCDVTMTVIVKFDDKGKIKAVEADRGTANIDYCDEHEESDVASNAADALESLIEGRHQLACPNYHTYGDFSPLATTRERVPCDCFSAIARDAIAELEAA